MVNYWHKRAFAELSTDPNDLGKRGLVFLVSHFFTVPGSASVAFALETNGTLVEFQFYDIASSQSAVRASLLEGASFTPIVGAISARNMNRNFPDVYSSTLTGASAVSGGVAIASELVGGGDKSGGVMSQNKVHVLRNDTAYLMTFVNTTNQSTLCHLNLGFSEGEPDPYKMIQYGINSGGVT
jgi:hypothetical protein